MADIIKTIMADIEADPTINSMDICLDESSKGVLKKRKRLNVYGKVKSAAEKDKILRTVRNHAGSNYEIVDKLSIK